MQRDWLMTPVANPRTQAEVAYNSHHSSARSSIERAIGVLKRRWNCLKFLRLEPAKACKIITVCVMLHNRATVLNLDPPTEAEDVQEEEDAGELFLALCHFQILLFPCRSILNCPEICMPEPISSYLCWTQTLKQYTRKSEKISLHKTI